MIEVFAIIVILITCVLTGAALVKADHIIKHQRARITSLEQTLIICYHEAFPHIKQKIKEVLES